MRELDFINWIRSQSRFDTAAVPVGPGDDMAVVRCGDQSVLITVDQVLDGVHFVLAEHGPEAAGRKAMARNLSDVAAMAAMPLTAVASVALPVGTDSSLAQAIYRGLRGIGDEFRCPLVGGDVSTWDGALAISVTVLARPASTPPVLRDGALVGDAICVTGALGGAWKSMRHLEFQPRVNEAIALAGRCDLHAMIDISDGLASDLAHICRASNVGADVSEADVPIHADARASSSNPLAAALSDGEDYELLFTLPADQAEKLTASGAGNVPVSRIGTIVAGDAITLVGADAKRTPLGADGWEHET